MTPSRSVFILLSTALLVESMLYGVIAPLAPYYARELMIGPGQLGLIFAVYSLALLGASFPAGMACDRLSRRGVLLAGLVILMLSTLSYALVKDIGLMLAARFFQGMAGAIIWTAVLAEAAALYPAGERGGRMGLMMAITGLGTIIGPVVGGFASERWGYQAPFLGMAAVIFVVTLGLLLEKMPGAPAGQSVTGTVKPESLYRNSVDGQTIVLMLLLIAGSFGFGLLEPLLPLHLSAEFGLGGREIGIVFGVLGLAFTVFEPLMGFVSDRLEYKPLILAGLAGTAVVTPAIALVTSLPALYAVICMFSLFSCAMMVPCLPMLAEQSDRAGGTSYGRQFGLVNAAYSLGLLLGPLVGGLVAHYASFSAAALVYSVALVVPGIMILRDGRTVGAMGD